MPPSLIDWHSHHTPPELVAEMASLGGRAPKPDPYDSPRFSNRVTEMDANGIDIQLISQGAGLNADRLPPEQATAIVRRSNDLIGDRVALYPDRLMGTIAFTWADPAGSAHEIDRMAGQEGFRAVLMYARGDMIGREEAEPIFAAIARHNLPIFLHGGGAASRNDPDLERLEDGGQGVTVSAGADAAVSDCVVRMIASGLFDRYPNLQLVIRSSGGGVPLLLNKLWWKHNGPSGEQRYSEILLQHFSVDCASSSPRTLQFLIDTMGEGRVVFGSDYCGGLGPLEKALTVVEEQPDPWLIRSLTEKNSRALLHI
jgi:5-carboxyvanillate decarboxylase